MIERNDRLKALFDSSGFGLEIGPSYNPVLRKAEGYNVETVDHADAETLRSKYRTMPGYADIEEVDYVSDGRSLLDLIGRRKSYDFIIASHVIEHVTDMVTFLHDCDQLLRDGGALVLAVPDKRYCFDVFRPLTTIGEVSEAYFQKRVRHSPATLIDDVLYSVSKPTRFVWSDKNTSDLRLRYSPDDLRNILSRIKETHYIDAHAWCFVPSSFVFIIEKLNNLGLSELGVSHLSKSSDELYQHEFFVVLSRDAQTGQAADVDRFQDIETELREIDTPDRISDRIKNESMLRKLAETLSASVQDERRRADEAERRYGDLVNTKTFRYTAFLRNQYARLRS